MLNSLHGTDLIVISSHHHDSTQVRTSELMAKMALYKRVYFFAAPKISGTKKPMFYYLKEYQKVTVVQPFLPESSDGAMVRLMKEFIKQECISRLTIWTDTPKALPFIESLDPEVTVFDQTKFALNFSNELNQELLERANLTFGRETTKEELSQNISYLSERRTQVRLPPLSRPRYQDMAL